MKRVYLVLLASLLAACSSSNNIVKDSLQTWDSQFADEAKLTAQLRSENIKPVALNNLAFQMAALDNSNPIDISADSPVVNFSEGNSFVSALFLPDEIKRFTFVLESKAGRTVFVPSVVFLNENLRQIARIDNAQFDDRGLFFIEKAFTGANAQAIRYILIYSKDSDLDGKTEVVNVAREYELKKGNAVSEVTFPKLYSKHSPVGHLNIRFQDVFFSAEATHNKQLTESIKQNKTVKFATPSIVEAPAILTDTEAFYLQQISKAIKEDNLSRAKQLVEEAKRAGSRKAQSYYQKEIDKQQ